MVILIKQKIKNLICRLIYGKVVPFLSKKRVPYSLNCLGESVDCFELKNVQAGVYLKHSTEFLFEQKFLDACNVVKNGLPVSAKKTFREDLRLRYYTACKVANIASTREGDFVTIGVSFGVMPRLILEYTQSNKFYWLIDAWDGFDPYRSKVTGAHEIHDGYCANVDDVREIFGTMTTPGLSRDSRPGHWIRLRPIKSPFCIWTRRIRPAKPRPSNICGSGSFPAELS